MVIIHILIIFLLGVIFGIVLELLWGSLGAVCLRCGRHTKCYYCEDCIQGLIKDNMQLQTMLESPDKRMAAKDIAYCLNTTCKHRKRCPRHATKNVFNANTAYVFTESCKDFLES